MKRLPGSAPTSLLLITCALAASLLAGCSGGAASGSPASSPGASGAAATPVDPTPVIPTASPDARGYWLRMTTSQAIPPVNLFAVGPTAVIDAAGRYLVPGAVPAIYPGPLVTPFFARQVSDAGRAQIVGWAEDLGLLSGPTDFTGGNLMPGGVTGRIELTVDGRPVSLTGVPGSVPTPDPQPGTPAAFAELWSRIERLPETLPGELGPEQPHTPPAYALLVGPPPAPEGGIAPNLADWPLATPLATFGGPVMDGSYRCGLVEGADADVLRPSLEAANQLTQWVQDPDTSATFGLTVRPIVAGEDPCRDVFGPGG